MDVLSDKIVVTRKEHQCFGCDRIFPRGTVMQVLVSVEDCFYRTYTCTTCQRIMQLDAINLCDPWEGYHEGCVAEAIDDNDEFNNAEDYLLSLEIALDKCLGKITQDRNECMIAQLAENIRGEK